MLIIKNNYHGGLDDFEEEIKVNIPTDYKQFIEKYNGGDTPNTKIQTKHISTDVRVFYGIGNCSHASVKRIKHGFPQKQETGISLQAMGNGWLHGDAVRKNVINGG